MVVQGFGCVTHTNNFSKTYVFLLPTFLGRQNVNWYLNMLISSLLKPCNLTVGLEKAFQYRCTFVSQDSIKFPTWTASEATNQQTKGSIQCGRKIYIYKQIHRNKTFLFWVGPTMNLGGRWHIQHDDLWPLDGVPYLIHWASV